jgi:hypothetical protein
LSSTQLDEMADAVWRWTGNHAGIVEIGEGDLGSA